MAGKQKKQRLLSTTRSPKRLSARQETARLDEKLKVCRKRSRELAARIKRMTEEIAVLDRRVENWEKYFRKQFERSIVANAARQNVSVNTGQQTIKEQNMGSRNRELHMRDNIGGVVNLGEIKDSVVQSIARIPSDAGEKAEELKTVLKQLVELLHDAPDEGVDEQLAADALAEVENIAETAQKPWGEKVLSAMQRTVRTMRGIGAELAKVPAVAAQFTVFVEHIAKILTG